MTMRLPEPGPSRRNHRAGAVGGDGRGAGDTNLTVSAAGMAASITNHLRISPSNPGADLA